MNSTSTYQWIEDFAGHEVPEMLISSGVGGWVQTGDQSRVYEALSGHSCLNLGHAHPELRQAACSAIDQLSYCSPEHASPPSIALSRRLSTLLGGEFMIKYALSGASSNEVALAIARSRWAALGLPEKRICLTLDRSYHGQLGQAKHLTGFGPFRDGHDPISAGVVHVAGPRGCETGRLFDLDEIRRHLEHDVARIGASKIACLFVEPVNFAGGVIVPPRGYLRLLRDICDQHQITLIVDEIITGFGRSGSWFAFQQEGIRPDIVTMAKGITAGYFPLGAVAVDRAIYDDLQARDYPLKLVITMAGHPIGCAIALKALEIIERDNLLTRVRENERHIFEALAAVRHSPIIRDIRGLGHMWGIEFSAHGDYPASQIAARLAAECFRNGCLIAAADGIVRINPPLNMSGDERDQLLNVITRTVNRIASEFGTS